MNPITTIRKVIWPYRKKTAGGKIVTAPSCGACGVLPTILFYHQKIHNSINNKIVRALATAGNAGNHVKHNASISGGEVGTACAMASAALA